MQKPSVSPRKTVTPIASSAKKETPNLKNIFEQKPEKETEKSDEQETSIASSDRVNKEVTIDQVKSTINQFLGNHKVTSSVKVILSKEFELQEGHIIVLPISNKVEINMVEKIEQELLDYLRNQLENYSLDIEYNVLESHESHKPYTSAEVFDAMAKKNPALLKLKDVLGLDTDF